MFTGPDRRGRAALLPEHRRQGQSASPTRARIRSFLEPEGLTTHEFYPNGISTSLPFDIQIAAVHSMVGLETRATSCGPGYAIEYDYFDSPRAEAELRDPRDPWPVSSPARSNGTDRL